MAPEGRAWSRPLGNPQQQRARIGRGQEESGLPISDLQPVPSCFTFSSFRVSAQSPVMRSTEASGSPDCCLGVEPEWGSLPSAGHLALTFSVALSCRKTLCPRSLITITSLDLPPTSSSFTPQTLRASEAALFWALNLGARRTPGRSPISTSTHHTKPPGESSTTCCLSEDS